MRQRKARSVSVGSASPLLVTEVDLSGVKDTVWLPSLWKDQVTGAAGPGYGGVGAPLPSTSCRPSVTCLCTCAADGTTPPSPFTRRGVCVCVCEWSVGV